MTPDGPTPGELDPEQEESVRRLLAAAAEPEPLPRDVADRLDDALADLVAERAEGTPAEPVGRTRRRWPAVLVAAAAVAALAGGVGNMLVSGGPGSNSAVTSSEAGASDQSQPAAPSGAPTPQQGLDSTPHTSVPTLALKSFHTDAQGVASQRFHSLVPYSTQKRGQTSPPAEDCGLPTLMPGDRLLAVRLDDKPATLVFRAPEGSTSLAQVYACDDPSQAVKSTEIDVH